MANDSAGFGLDAATGRRLAGWDHVVQSLRDIFTTRFGSRVMREFYGSFVPEALGRNITRGEILPVIASITTAIEQWEPRFLVVDVQIGGEVRAGAMTISVVGQYRPRALLGDLNPEGTKSLGLSLGANSVSII